jgi:hypothetical protein
MASSVISNHPKTVRSEIAGLKARSSSPHAPESAVRNDNDWSRAAVFKIKIYFTEPRLRHERQTQYPFGITSGTPCACQAPCQSM